MLHGLRIKDGKATYVSRFVKTSRLKQEEFFGAAKFPKVMPWTMNIYWLYMHIFSTESMGDETN
jgi:carotenoid cleavage dioxygenase-like enzyme